MITFTGELKDFIKSFPWTIAITLFVSLAVAMFIIPFLQYAFIKKGLIKTEDSPKKKSFLEKLQLFYNNMLPRLFKHPYWAISSGIASIVLAGIDHKEYSLLKYWQEPCPICREKGIQLPKLRLCLHF